MKRIILFLMTNLAVVLVLGIVLSVIFSFTGMNSRSTGGLLILAIVFGFGGSFISLAISKWMAKRSTGAVVIKEATNEMESWLMKTVKEQADKSGIRCPEVAIYDADEMNAFATGMNKNKALVAVSSGLLNSMTRDEAEAVLAHEVSHIASGDMVTLALIQGVVNTFVIFIARIVGGIIDNFISGSSDDESSGHGFSYFIIVFILEMIFGVLASTIVMYYSRKREFSADAGAASLVGKEKMIAALQRLSMGAEPQLTGSLMAFGISGKRRGGLFMSHPPIESRIEALQQISY